MNKDPDAQQQLDKERNEPNEERLPETGSVQSDSRRQPWKMIIDSIQEQNKQNPTSKDLFPCRDELYDHSLGA
jgi:hypothetical protein